MDQIITFANTIFSPIIAMGAAPMMLIVLTIIALFFKVKFSQALMGGIKLAIAITGISAIISMLTTAFQGPMAAFIESTGLQLTITDVGWAPLATITWANPATLYFLLIVVLLDVVMIVLDKTNTIDVDIFDIWHLAFVGLACMFFGQVIGASDGLMLLIASVLVLYIGGLKIINSDLMKPTFNDLLDVPDSNPMTTTHMNYMMNPINMIFNKIFETPLLRWVDKYDFDAAKLNAKIGFWGSKFAIGIYLGVFVGLLGLGSPATLTGIADPTWMDCAKTICTLAFTGGVCLELFSLIGSWFIAAIEPLSQGITNFANNNKHLKGRSLNVGLDWPFIAGRAEIWAAANILAPIMLLEALVLPWNGLLPLGGIIAMGVTPSLLVVTRGKMIRMIVIGALILPVFLWAGTLVAPFVTSMANTLGAMPQGVTGMISQTTMEGPVEKFLAYLIGHASQGDIQFILWSVLGIAVYTGLFVWYRHEMIKRNYEYAKVGKCKADKLLTGKYTQELLQAAEANEAAKESK